jgi:TRAP-type uncharacterized transport system fused permease subunit
MLAKFFALWREWSERITRVLVVCFGVIAISGAWQGYKLGIPLWQTAVFFVAGVLLLVSHFWRK